MKKSPQQAIFDVVFATSVNLGYATYDYLPPDEVSYPFVFVGEQFDNDIETKTAITGLVTQTIHIYHTHKKRRELTGIMDTLKMFLRKLKRADKYRISVRSVSSQTLIDNTTGEPLLHGILEIEFRYS